MRSITDGGVAVLPCCTGCASVLVDLGVVGPGWELSSLHAGDPADKPMITFEHLLSCNDPQRKYADCMLPFCKVADGYLVSKSLVVSTHGLVGSSFSVAAWCLVWYQSSCLLCATLTVSNFAPAHRWEGGVLIPRSPPPDRRAVRSALDSWSRTARLCLIYLTMNVPVDVLAWLIKH